MKVRLDYHEDTTTIAIEVIGIPVIGLESRFATETANPHRGVVCTYARSLQLRTCGRSRSTQQGSSSVLARVSAAVSSVKWVVLHSGHGDATRRRGLYSRSLPAFSISFRFLQVDRDQRPGVEAEVVVRVDHVQPVASGSRPTRGQKIWSRDGSIPVCPRPQPASARTSAPSTRSR